jgi:hypothetical protein
MFFPAPKWCGFLFACVYEKKVKTVCLYIVRCIKQSGKNKDMNIEVNVDVGMPIVSNTPTIGEDTFD